jgi:hypothetical protein
MAAEQRSIDEHAAHYSELEQLLTNAVGMALKVLLETEKMAPAVRDSLVLPCTEQVVRAPAVRMRPLVASNGSLRAHPPTPCAAMCRLVLMLPPFNPALCRHA